MGKYLAISQVGLEMVVPIVVGLAVDRYTGWEPVGVITGVIVGFVGGLTHLIFLANRAVDEPGATSTRDKQP
jgi:F0F1-type ATP synthase assembly protein I